MAATVFLLEMVTVVDAVVAAEKMMVTIATSGTVAAMKLVIVLGVAFSWLGS